MEPSDRSGSERKKSKRTSRSSNGLLRALRSWWPEIIIGLLILLAIFLLVEQMNIRESLYSGLMRLLDGLSTLGQNLAEGAATFIRGTTLSDMTAYLLILVVLGLVLWRTRQRVLAHPGFTDLKCPECGGDLHRIHRHWYDRLINLLVPVRRYRCRNRECQWSGLRAREPYK